MAKTSTGIQENVAGLFCYSLGWITGFVFILLEQENKFVRFHAMQSIIVFGSIFVIGTVMGWIPLLGWAIAAMLGVLGFILWIVLMVKAYQGELYKLVWAGNLAVKWSAKPE